MYEDSMGLCVYFRIGRKYRKFEIIVEMGPGPPAKIAKSIRESILELGTGQGTGEDWMRNRFGNIYEGSQPNTRKNKSNGATKEAIW